MQIRLSQIQREESIRRWYGSIPSHELASAELCRGAPILTGERPDDRLGGCVSERIEHESDRRRNSAARAPAHLPHDLCTGMGKRVIVFSCDERLRPPVLR